MSTSPNDLRKCLLDRYIYVRLCRVRYMRTCYKNNIVITCYKNNTGRPLCSRISVLWLGILI